MKWTLCLLVVMATLTLASSSDEPVNGAWGEWWQNKFCSVTCGQGTIEMKRTCDNPAPKNGGNDCPGNDNLEIPCEYESCDNECWKGPGNSGPCKNGGECEDQDLATEGTFTCTCKRGYTGDTCEKADCQAIPNTFACSDGRKCILNDNVCDKEEDCDDGSDEVGCGDPVNCDENTEFQCDYKTYPKCWKNEKKCDYLMNCDDLFDENNCPARKCKANEFLCKDKDEGIQECMPDDLKCDGVFDCQDNSDEKGCTAECQSDYTKMESYCVIRGASALGFEKAKEDCKSKRATLWPSSSISKVDQGRLIPAKMMNKVSAWTEVGSDVGSGCQVWSFKGEKEKTRKCGQESTYFCFIHLSQK